MLQNTDYKVMYLNGRHLEFPVYYTSISTLAFSQNVSKFGGILKH